MELLPITDFDLYAAVTLHTCLMQDIPRERAVDLSVEMATRMKRAKTDALQPPTAPNFTLTPPWPNPSTSTSS